MHEHPQPCVQLLGRLGKGCSSPAHGAPPSDLAFSLWGMKTLSGKMPPANATHLAATEPPFLASAVQGKGWCESSKFLLGDMEVEEGVRQKNILKNEDEV